jgi:hypothetical protein
MISEYPCHESLKGGQCITVTLLHDMGYKCSQCRSEPHLPDIVLIDSDLFVCVRHIDFCSISCMHYIHSYLILVREWGDILEGVVILFPCVNYCTQFSALLWDTKKRRSLVYCFHLPPPGHSITGDFCLKFFLQSFGTLWSMMVVP